MKNDYRGGIKHWSIPGINVLVLREIMLKNKNNFEIVN
jgi:hypothetical protein